MLHVIKSVNGNIKRNTDVTKEPSTAIRIPKSMGVNKPNSRKAKKAKIRRTKEVITALPFILLMGVNNPTKNAKSVFITCFFLLLVFI